MKISRRTIFVTWYWNISDKRNIYIPVNIFRNPSSIHFSYLALDDFEVIFGSFISFGPLVKMFLIILGSFSTPTPIRKLLEPTLYTLKATCLRYSPQKPHIISAFLFKIYVLFLIVCDSRRIFSFPKSDDITIKYTLQVHIY